MIEYGMRLFGTNPAQLLLIIICSGLVIGAQQLAINLSDMSLSMFISTEFNNIFADNQSHNFFNNVFLPSIMYMIASVLLVWMGVTNFAAIRNEESKFNGILKFLLALIQIALFFTFFFVGGKLLFYSVIFSLIIFVSAIFILGALTSEKKQG
ncbi:hypothetical protein [Lentibacillus sediminis]|uniref:hypothetical protein n=1 Tax=Lentibacillus sediminis TaxID=1940529 RepID=UPI000C1C249B|nr:hypothetical protein [Lentibacillus sediminis]